MGYPEKWWSHYPWNSSKNEYRHDISQCSLVGIVAFSRRLNLVILVVFSKFTDSVKATHSPARALPVGAAGHGAQLLQQHSRGSSRVLQLRGKSHFCISTPRAAPPLPCTALCLPSSGNAPSNPQEGPWPPAARLGAVPGRCSPAQPGASGLPRR